MLNVTKFSSSYNVRVLCEEDILIIYNLCKNNQLFYEYMKPFVTLESIKADLKALPPRKELKDKYYVGYFFNDKLIAVMDFIDKFPNDYTGFIGFFMLDKCFQGKGIGSKIISEFEQYLKGQNITDIRLGYISGNSQSESFWLKNGFIPNGAVSCQEEYKIIYLNKKIVGD